METENQTGYSEITFIAKYSDILMAISAVVILVVMIIPLPAMLLDILLSFNITFALIILLVGMYISKPLELSAFPSIFKRNFCLF